MLFHTMTGQFSVMLCCSHPTSDNQKRKATRDQELYKNQKECLKTEAEVNTRVVAHYHTTIRHISPLLFRLFRVSVTLEYA